jgi:hypothetical protein
MKNLIKFSVFASVLISTQVVAQTTNPNNPNRRDTIQVVQGVNSVKTNVGTVKLPNILAIPAEAFQASNQNGNNGYYKIRKDGLGTLAGSGETINNSLIAPLNLPNGAVITRVEFNMLSIAGQGYMPHLRLVQKGLVSSATQDGAYLGIIRINKYSVNSHAFTGKGGLLDVQTLRSDPMNLKISNQSNSYYFEILANKSDSPPANASQSFWPNDNYLFVWSVVVYYTLN